MPCAGPGATTLTRDGAVVAVVRHRPGLLDDPRLVDEIQRAARLAIDHERLQADLSAQLARLRESRARIATTADAERRRLERNLHDGAQQGLVRLAMAAGSAAASAADPTPALGRARDEIRAALEDLRALAHGIFPAVLEDQGLSAAIVSLAEWDPRVNVSALPDRRCSAQTEAAAYFCLAGVARSGGRLDISGTVQDGWLVLTLRVDDLSPETATEVEDRDRGARRPRERQARRRRPRAPPPRAPMRIVLAEDEVLLREGLARLLIDAGFEVVGKAGDAAALLRLVDARRPELVLTDIKMPPTHSDEGLEAAREIGRRHPGTGVLVLSHYLESGYALRLLEDLPQRSGYLLKDRVSDVAVLTDALRRIAHGECVIDPTIVSRLLARHHSGPLADLTGPRARDPRADGRGALQRRDLPAALPEPQDG